MKKVALKTQDLIKSFFKALLTFFREEESKKEKEATQIPSKNEEANQTPCEKQETTQTLCEKEERKKISLEKMEEFCQENGFFHDSVTKDILDSKSEYFYVIKGERRFIIQKTGDQEEVLATLTRGKTRKRQDKKTSHLNL